MNNTPLICRKGTLQGPDHVQSLTFRQRLPDRWRPLQPQPVLDETRTYSVFALARTRDERLSRSRTRRGIRGATRFARFATIPGGSAKPQSSHRPGWGPEAPGQEPSRISLSVATSTVSATPDGFHSSAYEAWAAPMTRTSDARAPDHVRGRTHSRSPFSATTATMRVSREPVTRLAARTASIRRE